MNWFLNRVVFMLLSELAQTTFSEDGRNIVQNDEILKSVKAKIWMDATSLKIKTNLNVRSKREAAIFKQSVGVTRNMGKSADYLEATRAIFLENLRKLHPNAKDVTDFLTPEQNQIISQLTGCAYQYLPKVCEPSPYRSITGECNNRNKPYLGASNTAFKRLRQPQYEDGVSLPRGFTTSIPINGFPLPSAREVSDEVFKLSTESLNLDNSMSPMFMQFGQFIDHDIGLPVPSLNQNVDCNSCIKKHPCFPIMIPATDPRSINGTECIPMIRTAAVCSLTSVVREQLNSVTSFMDASQVYGSNKNAATLLRNNTNQRGLLAVNQNFSDNGLPFLPFRGNKPDQCSRTNLSLGLPCFVAGDFRSNQQPMLMSYHTLFLREHNRIANKLLKLNQDWSGEKLYQEARKIIIAVTQKITYNDWLPLLLGDEMPKVLPTYKSYSEDEDPTASNVFTIGFRMGQRLMQPLIYRLADDYGAYPTEPVVPLPETFFATWRIVRQGGIDPILRGMMVNKAKLNRQDQIMVDALRQRLFQVVNRLGSDLASLNIQRGRDHGLPGYNEWRRFCGLPAPRDVDELAKVLTNNELAQKVIDLYGTPENIDPWIGGVSEPPVPNGRTGVLLSCLIGDQFRRSRNGDRHYYENPSVFSPAQRRSIESVTLSHIICANTNIREVPQNVFKANQYPEDFIDCSSFQEMDLQPWKD